MTTPNRPEPPPDTGVEKAHPFYVYLLAAAGFYIFIQSFSLLSPILFSFLLIVLVSLAVNPLIARMRGWAGGRTAATGLLVTGIALLAGLAAWGLYAPLQNSAGLIGARLPGYWERLQKPLIRMEKQSVMTEAKLQSEVTTEVVQKATDAGEPQTAKLAKAVPPPKPADQPGFIRSSLGDMAQSLIGSFSAIAFNAAQILVVLITVFFGVTFTLMNPRPIFSAIFAVVPERQHARTLVILRRISEFVPRWAMATLLAMLTVGLLVFFLMWPLFGFADALVLGLIAGIFEAVPYLGPILSAIPALLFALGEGGMAPLWVVLAYFAIQLLENNVIIPLIVAGSMKLHPVAVMFSILFCVALFGVLGVVVAAPMVAITEILYDEIYRKRFLPAVTDAHLDRLARGALREKMADK
jgi:predicted PurR-regulated permease PerM